MPRIISDLLDERVQKTPHALSFEQTVNGRSDRATWAEFKHRCDAMTLALEEIGLARGDSVAIMGQTSAEWGITDLGVVGAGGVSVGVYSTLSPSQVEYLLKDCNAKLAFAGSKSELQSLREAGGVNLKIVGWGDADGVDGALSYTALVLRGMALLKEKPQRIAELRAAASPDDLALIIYTSGTTGVPKGAMIAHRSCVFLLVQLETILPTDALGLDVTVSFLPMAHVAEHLIGFYGRINAGYGTRYVGSLDSKAVLAAVTGVRPTVFGSVPRIFEKGYAKVRQQVAAANPRRQAIFAWGERVGRAMSRHHFAGTTPPLALRAQHLIADRLVLSKIRNAFGGRVKYFISGAAPIDVEILEFFHACGMIVFEVYGQTECMGICTANRKGEAKFGTVGRPVPGVEVKLDKDGEILVRGPSVFKGYLNKPEETAETIDVDGWLHTGDIGEFDKDGYLRITDRKRNLIVTSGGKKVAPAPIEALLTSETILGPTLIVGESRPYMTALLTLDVDAARETLGQHGADVADLARHPEVRSRAKMAVEKANTVLARHEQIRRFRILDKALVVGSDELTPTMKLRRKAVSDRFKAEIESLYSPAKDEAIIEVKAAAGAEG